MNFLEKRKEYLCMMLNRHPILTEEVGIGENDQQIKPVILQSSQSRRC